MSLANVVFEQVRTQFFIDNPDDHIQAHHVRGEFYEQRQLLTHSDVIPMQGTVIDVGANVGNHTLFYAKHTWAGRVYPLEPNPRARTLLEQNVAANHGYRAEINLAHVRLAVGAAAEQLSVVSPAANNLGGTHLIPGDGGVESARLDDLTFEGDVAFIKIDVEGMELAVLVGAGKLIKFFRPCIAVEIAERHESKFWAWIKENKYQIVNASCDYLHCKNYIVIPAF